MDWMQIIMLAMRFGPEIKRYIEIGLPIIDALKTKHELSELIPVLLDAARKLFPGITDDNKAATAAAEALFDPGGIEWVQRSLNKLENAGLDEDGVMGTMTRKAVENFQRKHQPDAGPVDGWPGRNTKAIIQRELRKLEG